MADLQYFYPLDRLFKIHRPPIRAKQLENSQAFSRPYKILIISCSYSDAKNVEAFFLGCNFALVEYLLYIRIFLVTFVFDGFECLSQHALPFAPLIVTSLRFPIH